MAFSFFENAINSGAQQMPNEMYRDLEQEFINMQFCNTSAKTTVQEQDGIGIDTYHDIEVWIDSTVADTTTGLKDSNDFNKLFFRDINHEVVRGLMYKFDNNYWIVNNFSKYSGLAQQCGIRRCNNRLKIVDPINGELQVIPCCVDYDMTSPSAQTSRYIITPNNHATVIVQGNDLTLRLFKTNTRYILSGRPFKLLAYQNAVEYSEEEQQTTLLYLDLYLDEIHDGDDLENGIADNGEFNILPSTDDDGIYFAPYFAKIRQYETIDFSIYAKHNEETYDSFDSINVELLGDAGDYVSLDGEYSITAKAISEAPIQILVQVQHSSPDFDYEQIFDIDVTSMMG